MLLHVITILSAIIIIISINNFKEIIVQSVLLVNSTLQFGHLLAETQDAPGTLKRGPKKGWAWHPSKHVSQVR